MLKYLLRLPCLCFFILLHGAMNAQPSLLIRPGEKWFGAAVNEAHHMPFTEGYKLDLNADLRGNQAAGLLLSTSGRFIWSEEPFSFRFENNRLVIADTHAMITIDSSGKTLPDAFHNAAARFFPTKNILPDTLLFSSPQYNTWIELVYNQNQADIMAYAHAIIDNGFPPGVLMIDDNWADYYGRFDFRSDRFRDAAAMVDSLHQMGFKVMLWISPFVSPDTEVFRDLLEKELLLMDNGGKPSTSYAEATLPAIINWWNGHSAVLDFTNPASVKWFRSRLDHMVNSYHLDGFKLDAGDAEYYPANSLSFAKASPNEHSRLWGEVGLAYPLNEYRAMWKMGGEPLVQRLRDKQHSWTDLQKLIPHITTAGLLGYQFTCPDMIGGGEFGSFRDLKVLDRELVVRSAECSALMPMMQFSVAPWRVLDSSQLAIVKKTVTLRKKYTPYILQLAHEAAKTGDPIVRSMEFQFPGAGLADAAGQFMLGDRYLVAPVLTKENKKTVRLPKGSWKDDLGKIWKGPRDITLEVPLDRLPVFERITK
ncbi:MAG: glycoside hydrolase [Chitinophagaceae bacterium]|nr:MAG: glycoside hydrolase [Chitinophagaceae bacterium]